MGSFVLQGVAPEITDLVRSGVSPGYNHPVMREVAQGTGPCRACLQPFAVGQEERLLFTYRPVQENGTISAPGPVFIHAEECPQYRGSALPPALHSFSLVLEARAADGRVPVARQVSGADADAALAELLSDPAVEYVHVRNAVAGCHIVRVDRV